MTLRGSSHDIYADTKVGCLDAVRFLEKKEGGRLNITGGDADLSVRLT